MGQIVIFSNFERTAPERALYCETDFEFYNRCDSIAVSKIRSEIETWLTKYPPAHQEELVTRFQKDDFTSAFFELFVHELLIRQGCRVTVHPTIGTKGKYPDFEIQLPDDERTLILEATLCLDDKADDATASRMRPIYDSINAIACPFFILIRHIKLKSHAHQPSSKRIAGFFRELGTLAVEDAAGRSPYEDELVSIDFGLVPKSQEALARRGCSNIGRFPVRMRWGSGTESGRRTLNAKGKHYGTFEKPFVIALNTIGPWGYNEDQHLEMLFGTRQEYVKAGSGELCVRTLNDGFWGSEESPKYTRVSAVLFACAHPTKIRNADFCLYRNPWAVHPVPMEFWKLPTVDLSGDTVTRKNPSATAGAILGLSHDWPGELFSE